PAAKDQAIQNGTLLTTGISASPGAAVGKAIFDPTRADELGNAGEKVILVRPETSPDDVHGMIPAQGVLTSRGGKTSHAAVVARGMGKPAVVGAEELSIDPSQGTTRVGGKVRREREWVWVGGATGGPPQAGDGPAARRDRRRPGFPPPWRGRVRERGNPANQPGGPPRRSGA